jgi:2-oxoglutarate dehydrogenase E2 component (dihydrolipoamide succinyltransferase)
VPSASAAKIMKDQGIDPASVNGTGKDGRVTKADVLALGKSTTASTPAPAQAPSTNQGVPSFAGDRSERREKMSQLRKKIAQRLVAVKNETAMLTTFNEVDLSAVMEIRKKYKDKFKEVHEVNLGFMSFFTKAVCEALKLYPAVNGQIQGDELVYFNYADIGIAVSTERGLVVPNIRNADKMSLAEIEKAIMAYAAKARENKITLDDMTGGTFTITNGGVFGSLMSTPIINPPQSAILGMHNIVQRPIAVNGQVEIRPMMYIALSYDHRIIDGKESVSFLVKVKEQLEDPARMLLGI